MHINIHYEYSVSCSLFQVHFLSFEYCKYDFLLETRQNADYEHVNPSQCTFNIRSDGSVIDYGL